MSLINQMLKDLEHRAKRSVNSELTLSGLKASVLTKIKYTKNVRLFLITGILLTFISSGFMLIKNHVKKKAIMPAVTATAKTPVFINNKKINNNIIHSGRNEQHATASVITGLTVQVQKQKTILRLLLSQDTLYRVSKNVKQEYVIVLNHAQMVSTLPPINALNSAIQSIRMANQRDGDLVIIISVRPNVEMSYLELINPTKYPELQIDFIDKNDASSNLISQVNAQQVLHENGAVKKIMVNMSAEDEYQQALQYYAQGLINKAASILSNLVIKFPEYDLARESLVRVLLDQGKQTEAKDIVQTGLQRKPFYYPYAELKARILVKEGHLEDAINTLQSTAPALNKNPEYHAFIAALYQRQGNSLLAAKLYEQLLPLEPDNAMWWMGLGIAYEDLGKSSEALQAYARAERNDNLNPELKAYVQGRIHTLQ
jgi:tetratricopeptide (TPR) repeat protein